MEGNGKKRKLRGMWVAMQEGRLVGLRKLVPKEYEQKLLEHNHATYKDARKYIVAQVNLRRSPYVEVAQATGGASKPASG